MSKKAILDDPAVAAALKQLGDAIDAAAAKLGIRSVASAVVINRPDAAEAASEGCTCSRCAARMAMTLLESMGASKMAASLQAAATARSRDVRVH